MWVLALEALVALSLLILIVWLTMGSARRRDAPPADPPSTPPKPPDAEAPPKDRDA